MLLYKDITRSFNLPNMMHHCTIRLVKCCSKLMLRLLTRWAGHLKKMLLRYYPARHDTSLYKFHYVHVSCFQMMGAAWSSFNFLEYWNFHKLHQCISHFSEVGVVHGCIKWAAPCNYLSPYVQWKYLEPSELPLVMLRMIASKIST